MTLIVVIILWAVAVGLFVRREGPARSALLIAGVTGAVAVQYFLLGLG